MISNIRRFTREGEDSRESGQVLVEYALILMLVTILAVTALELIGTSVQEALSEAAAGFGGA